jgi:hypothetical protein
MMMDSRLSESVRPGTASRIDCGSLVANTPSCAAPRCAQPTGRRCRHVPMSGKIDTRPVGGRGPVDESGHQLDLLGVPARPVAQTIGG